MSVAARIAVLSGVLQLGCAPEPALPPEPFIEWLAERRGEMAYPGPPLVHDVALAKLPRPLSVDGALRILTEATVYAPSWESQSAALRTLEAQPDATQLLERAFECGGGEGKMLVLDALGRVEPTRFARLAMMYEDGNQRIRVISGCSVLARPAAELLEEIREQLRLVLPVDRGCAVTLRSE